MGDLDHTHPAAYERVYIQAGKVVGCLPQFIKMVCKGGFFSGDNDIINVKYLHARRDVIPLFYGIKLFIKTKLPAGSS